MSQTFQIVRPDELELHRHDGPPPQLVDCRTPAEFAEGHVPGSINIPVEEIQVRRHDIDPERPVVFICRSGRRAEAAAGFVGSGTPVAVLEGGVIAWAASGRELVGNRNAKWSIERQVRFVAGSIVALGGIGALFDPGWAAVPVLVGLGLTFAAVTNTCALGEALMRMPWNRKQS